MRAAAIFLFLLFLISEADAQTIQLSPNAEIYAVTCGPYQEELYSAFGHSAIRVKDSLGGFDLIYNYGVFSFDQPNFYLNFAKGHLLYRLAVYDYGRFRYSYIVENRYIHEQLLNLQPNQKQQLFDFLEWNALPENQQYYYDYFYDNCATRIRDAVVKAFGDSVAFDGSYITTDYTIRQLTDMYLVQQPWGDFGIDIGLGLPIDKKATPYEYMYLPDYIESGFNHATILHNGVAVPLVKKTVITYESRPEKADKPLFTPFVVFSILLLSGIFITYRGYKKGKGYFQLDVVIFSVAGLVGYVLFLLWTATDHKASAQNFNLLWAIPLHFPIALFLLKKNVPKFMRGYFIGVFCLNLLLLITWNWLPQQLNYSLIPLVMYMALRSFYIAYYIKIRNNSPTLTHAV